MKKLPAAICLLAALACAGHAAVRIEWRTPEFVGAGGYARAKKLSDGSLALVFSNGPDICLKIKKGDAWGPSVRAARPPARGEYNYTNAELAELPGGKLFLLWNARPVVRDGGPPYKIMGAFSTDGGASWGAQRDLCTGGNTFGEGCWEPCPLVLPDGEIQVWFANEHGIPGRAQEIAVLRSRDGGESWLPPATASFREKHRDGMPVPVRLRNGSVVAAIEDDGISGRFKPAIISPDAAFKNIVGGGSPRRWPALAPRAALPPEIYAGAPYLVQLPTGETVLSVQSTEGRRADGEKQTRFAGMRVYVGDASARNFAAPTTPFPGLPANAAALWNSLCVSDAETLLAVATLSGLPEKNGVWIVAAKIIREGERRCNSK